MKFQEIPYENPLDLFSKLTDEYKYLYLLESVEGPKKLAQFSFIGFNPRKLIRVKNSITEIIEGKERSEIKSEDPLEIIKKSIQSNRTSFDRFRFIGGAVGYISYDAIRYWEDLPHTSKDDLNLHDIEMGIYDDGIIFDHIQKKAYYYFFNENRFKELQNKLQKPSTIEKTNLRFSEPEPNISKEDFKESVNKAKKYIFEGDIFQVVLSKRYGFKFEGSLYNFYTVLRKINPSPYMYFLKYGDSQIIGASPEMLVRTEKGLVETYPIAGTRPRVDDPEENKRLGNELISDPKERAEHVMLVDLARNDIGRVSEPGSVQVPELMTVHQYSHVQHIVSRVIGRLSSNHDCFDALRVMLPAGTVSGAPKVRAMEIIEELEPSRRGPYAGAVGHFSYNGNCDFAITIRTLVAQGDSAYIQVGAGIVADSDPEKEWFETEHKGKALMRALAQAGEKF
ncbi:anthranilate synthase component I [Candidatus Bathyarchaeota archaeon]|nr:anthranilate synthase component I [Candidatus Bathyarchaeota archaeon]